MQNLNLNHTNINIVVFFIGSFFMALFVNKLLITFSLSQIINTFWFYSSWYNVNYFSDILILLSLFISFYSWIYLSERFLFKNNFFVQYLFIFFFCTLMMVYTSNLLVMFIFFEFIFVPSLFFAGQLSYSKKAEKTIEYLLVWTFSGAFIGLLGFAYLFHLTGSFNLAVLMNYKFSYFEIFSLFVFFFIGFGVKLPIWPFYFWLTKVHVEAPTGFSMFLSGFLVKTAFFCLSHVYAIIATKISMLIGACISIVGICDASFRMWSIFDIKRIVALATVQEMNMIVLFLFFLNTTHLTVLNNFLIIHGLLSVFFFFLVELVYKNTQTRNTLAISGLTSTLKTYIIFIWSALLIFRGFPLFVKFFIEWELASNLIFNFSLLGFIVFFLANMFGATAFFKNWLSLIYGTSPNLIFTNTILYKDSVLGFSLIFCLLYLSIVFFIL